MLKDLPPAKELDKQTYDDRVEELREKLLAAQFALMEAKRPIYILVTGIDGSGRGAFIHRLNEWMDPRGIETHGYWQRSDEEESRPYFWRFWRNMPRRGDIGIFVDAWYELPFLEAMEQLDEPGDIDLAAHHYRVFEKMLADDGAIVVKLFLYVSRDVQKMQLKEEAPRNLQNPRVQTSPDEWKGKFKRAMKAADHLLKLTDQAAAPWRVIQADHPYARDLEAGTQLLQAMEQALAGKQPAPSAGPEYETGQDRLAKVAMDKALEKEDYREQLTRYQQKLQNLAWEAKERSRSLVVVFEGWDAAGKGSAIRRVTQSLDPQLFKLVQYAAPTDEELAQHYLWRFWRRLQRDGRATLFDRSWYGRVLVERVEGFARDHEWQRAYEEINLFEEQLAYHGNIVVKFWLHISPEEQLRRFKEREEVPRKQYKITEEDWRNREKWPAYEEAVNDMVANTDSKATPWHIIAGNDKRYARIKILKTLCKALEKALD